MLGIFGSMERLLRAPEMETGAAATDAVAAAAPTSGLRRDAGEPSGVAPPQPHSLQSAAAMRVAKAGRVPRHLAPRTWRPATRHSSETAGSVRQPGCARQSLPGAHHKALRGRTARSAAARCRRYAGAGRGVAHGAWSAGDCRSLCQRPRSSATACWLARRIGRSLASFAEAALAGNWSGEQYSQAVRWYFAAQDQLLAERQRADGEFKHATARELSREWGNDYDVNRNTVVQFCDRHFAQDLKIDLLNARLADGSLLANHPASTGQFSRWRELSTHAARCSPTPRGPACRASRAASPRSRASTCAQPTAPTQWKTYWTGESGARMQQEYRGLLSAREQARGARS